MTFFFSLMPAMPREIIWPDLSVFRLEAEVEELVGASLGVVALACDLRHQKNEEKEKRENHADKKMN